MAAYIKVLDSHALYLTQNVRKLACDWGIKSPFGDVELACDCGINRSLSKWLLGCAISPYILALSLLCASSLFNSIHTAFCCVFWPLRSVSCSTTCNCSMEHYLHLFSLSSSPACRVGLPHWCAITILVRLGRFSSADHRLINPQTTAVSRSNFLTVPRPLTVL
jgi:hypothetical protein